MGTFGQLTSDDGEFACYTVEQPWRNNVHGHSCIPEGFYTCKRGHFPRHGEAFEVMDVPGGRTAILIHVANRAAELEGCIAPGDKLGTIIGDWAVLNSGVTYGKLMDHLKGLDEFTLQIRGYRP